MIKGAGWWTTRRFALIAVLLTALPLLWPPLPPLTDLPVQLGRYRVMLGGPDAEILRAWYRFEWRPIGYLGVDLLVAALAPLIGLEPALKAIVVTIPMAMAAALLWLSHEAHGRVQPMALLTLPFCYHYGFQFGFLNYSLAIVIALAGMALWLRLGRQGREAARALVFMVVGAAAWASHVFGWLILGLLVFAAELARQGPSALARPASWLQAGIRCLPIALPALMFLFWRPGSAATGSDWLESLIRKPGWLLLSLRDRWQWFDIATILVLAMLLYRAWRSPSYRSVPALAIAAGLILALFVAMPFGSAYGDARIAPLVWVLALLAIGADGASRREQATIALIGLALFAVRTTAATASFAIESGVWARHLDVLNHLPRGARLVSFVQASCKPVWRQPRTVHLPSLALARRAAFANDQPDLGSAALLTVIAPGIAGYANDPSQIVLQRPCPPEGDLRGIDAAIAGFPRDRFDYVWLVDAAPIDPRWLRGLRVVWRNDTDFLLAVEPPRLSGASSAD